MNGPAHIPPLDVAPALRPLLASIGKVITTRVDAFLLAESELNKFLRHPISADATPQQIDAEKAMVAMLTDQGATSLARLKQFFDAMGVDTDRLVEALK